jgi:hypothetical protein
MPAKFLNVHGHASFSTQGNKWSSHQAAITFGCKRDANGEVRSVYVSRVWGQRSAKGNSDDFVKPYFKEDEFQKMKDYARRRFEELTNAPRQRGGKKVEYTENPEHKQNLCEHCLDLGRNCTSRRVQ